MNRWSRIVAALVAGIVLALGLGACAGESGPETGRTVTSSTATGNINGTVTSRDGLPVTGVRVSIVGGPSAFGDVGFVTDSEGRFEFAGMIPGTYRIAVHDARGRRVAVAVVTVAGTGASRLPIVLGDPEDAPKGSIEGTITNFEDKPVAGLRVSIIDGSTAFPEIVSETDSEGKYRIDGVPVGTFRLAVHEPSGKRVGLGRVNVKADEVTGLFFRANTLDTSSDTAGLDTSICVGLVDKPSPDLVLKSIGAIEIPVEQGGDILSDCTIAIQTPDGSKSITLAVTKFASIPAAVAQYEVLLSTLAIVVTEDILGTRSFTASDQRIRYVVLQKNIHVLTIRTTIADGQNPPGIPENVGEHIVDLARTAQSRLP